MNVTINTLKDKVTTSIDNIVLAVDSNGFSVIVGSTPDDNTENYSTVFGYSTEYPISCEEFNRVSDILKECRKQRGKE